MKTNRSFFKYLWGSIALVTALSLVACGGGSSGGGAGSGSSTPAVNTTSAITAFTIPTGTTIINKTTHAIQVSLPSTTSSITALVPSFTSSTGSNVKVAGVVQVSGTTAQNFTSPVSYLVTAADGTTTTYVVTVIVAATNTNSLLTYSLAIPGPTQVSGVINPTTQTVSVVLPSGTAVTALVATFTSSAGSTVAIGSTTQVSNTTVNNFTNPVSYTVSNGGLVATYVVTVTLATAGAGPTPVALGNAGNFALFSKAGMSGDSLSSIVGDVGVSPVTSTSITTGFTPLTLSTSGTYATSGIVTGNVYAPDYTAPTPAYVISAEADMMTAYNNAGAVQSVGPTTVLSSGDLTGLTLAPGTYTSSVSLNLPVNTTLTLNGGPNDVWIIQVTGGLTTGANSIVALTGGALAKNVFWRLTTALTTGATSQFNGIVLAGTFITLGHQTQFNGRLLSQTFITLDDDAITAP